METLYDLLGALPHDNAEELRTAFRRAVKGAHPDIRPDDPDAALKFRQIIRANEILGDDEQRAVYDDLLKLAHLERKAASVHPVAVGLHRIVSGIIVLSWACVVIVWGYLLTSAGPVASAKNYHAMAALSWKHEPTTIANEPIVPPAAAQRQSKVDEAPGSIVNATPDLSAREVTFLRPEGASSCNGDLRSRIADSDHALQIDTQYLPAYVDPGFSFYRVGTPDRVFPDAARAKRIEKSAHAKSLPPIAPVVTYLTPVPQRRPAARVLSHDERLASVVRLR